MTDMFLNVGIGPRDLDAIGEGQGLEQDHSLHDPVVCETLEVLGGLRKIDGDHVDESIATAPTIGVVLPDARRVSSTPVASGLPGTLCLLYENTSLQTGIYQFTIILTFPKGWSNFNRYFSLLRAVCANWRVQWSPREWLSSRRTAFLSSSPLEHRGSLPGSRGDPPSPEPILIQCGH